MSETKSGARSEERGEERSDEQKVVSYVVGRQYNTFCCRFTPAVLRSSPPPHLTTVPFPNPLPVLPAL